MPVDGEQHDAEEVTPRKLRKSSSMDLVIDEACAQASLIGLGGDFFHPLAEAVNILQMGMPLPFGLVRERLDEFLVLSPSVVTVF